MANKIKCTCGHSWDKSDSSKKDASVCHICGKDNNMKNGGWLNKYETPQAENGIEGTMGGLTDEGFNYNGAWGGPSMQVGGSILKFLEPTSKKLPEGYNPIAGGSSTEYAVSIGGEDGEPAYLIPSFKYGELLLDPKAEFRRTGEHLGGPFKTYQEADAWERDVRHPYVEKGQSIPTPLKRWSDMAMGGSIPGSVGFTYARTQGAAPSNGPYAKKTKASAQNGAEMKFYQEGLDWKPRNISRNGSKIAQAQVGTMVTPLDFTKELGTLEGVSEVMSAPARTATYLLTGKYQDPSQALGIKNPWGAFAADVVLDPVNLIGAGVATKAAKATKAAVKASKESGVLSKAYNLNPWAEKLRNPNKSYRVAGMDAYDDFIETGILRSRNTAAPKLVEGTDFMLPPRTTPFPSFQKGYADPFYLPKEGGVVFETNLPTYKRGDINPVTGNKIKGKHYAHRIIDPETGSVVTDVSGENIKVFEGKPNWLKGYKEVPKSKKKEKGGDIKKDDMGYWNPENWGKPVEIGSNEITMQGVHEPLRGVSDTGDTKMMYPGKDYKFKGKKVREYPVSKNGGWLDKYK